MCVPTNNDSIRTRLLSEAEARVTGPRLFEDMHSFYHETFRADFPLFGQSSGWASWQAKDFSGRERRFDAPKTDGTFTIIPDIGGYDEISNRIGGNQLRNMCDVQWISDCVIEERFATMLADWSSQRITVRATRTYYVAYMGELKKVSSSSTFSAGTSAVVSRVLSMTGPEVFSRWAPVTEELDEFARSWNEQYALDSQSASMLIEANKQYYRSAKERVKEDLGFARKNLDYVKAQLADVNAEIDHELRILADLKSWRDRLRKSRNGVDWAINKVARTTSYSRLSLLSTQRATLRSERDYLYAKIATCHSELNLLTEKMNEPTRTPLCNYWASMDGEFSIVLEPLPDVVNLTTSANKISNPAERAAFERRAWAEFAQPFRAYADAFNGVMRSHPISNSDRGKAVLLAAQDVSYIDVNTVLYLRDLKESFGEIRSLFEFLKNPSVLTASALVLGATYGTRLTYFDTLEIIQGVRRAIGEHAWTKAFSKVQASVSSSLPTPLGHVSRRITASIYYDQTDDTTQRVLSALDEWDVYPSFANLWDMIPYSFVIDWFADVESFLSSVDLSARALRLPLKLYFSTSDERIVATDRLRDVLISGQTVYFERYDRQPRSKLDLYVSDIEFSPPNVSVIPQAASLLFQFAEKI